MRKACLAALCLTGVLLPGLALAAPIPVHNTGVNSSDVLVAADAQTAFWTLSAKPPAAPEAIGSNPFRYHNPGYFADTLTAAWVAPQAGGNAGPLGTYTYDLAIDLTGLDPATASITGLFGSDNAGSIWLNANPPVATTGSGGFGVTTPFTMNSGFVSGVNTIHAQVNNEGDPTAIFVSFTTATATPLPTVPALPWPALVGLALLVTGLGSFFAARRASSLR